MFIVATTAISLLDPDPIDQRGGAIEITQEQADRISRLLHEEKRIFQECPVCHAPGDTWTLADRIWELREFSLFFSAIVGLIELEEDEEDI